MAEAQPYTSIRIMVRYAKCRFTQYKRDEAYRFFLTEVLRTVSENTARMGGGRTINLNYSDYMDKAMKPADRRTGDEVAADIINRAGLHFEGN